MPSIDRDLVALLPNLRAYALFLTGNRADADDLVQDTAVRLLAAVDRFEKGTNFKAWAFRVLRNRFLNEFVAKRRQTRPLHEIDDALASVFPDQMDGLELKDLVRQFMRLPPEFRSVLALAGGANMSYEEIAAISGCAVGTVKSRVHRARAALHALLREAYAPNGARPQQPVARHQAPVHQAPPSHAAGNGTSARQGLCPQRGGAEAPHTKAQGGVTTSVAPVTFDVHS
jgi:RNA polymerase sigma-70 factor (ECF subfamily)